MTTAIYEPPPDVIAAPTGTEARVCSDIAARQALGRKKYGMQISDNKMSVRDAIQNAYEEALDQCVYLRKCLEICDESKPST